MVVPQNRYTLARDKHFLVPAASRASASQVDDPLQCPQCPYHARSVQGLSRHLTQAHAVGDREWSCECCGKAFFRKGALTTHLPKCRAAHDPNAPAVAPPPRAVARSSAPRPFVCPDDHCQLSFLSVSALNRHTREQCLGRQGSGAVLQPDGRYALQCAHAACAGSTLVFYDTKALGLHRRKVHG